MKLKGLTNESVRRIACAVSSDFRKTKVGANVRIDENLEKMFKNDGKNDGRVIAKEEGAQSYYNYNDHGSVMERAFDSLCGDYELSEEDIDAMGGRDVEGRDVLMEAYESGFEDGWNYTVDENEDVNPFMSGKDALSRIAQAMKGQDSVSAFDFFGTDDEDIFSFAESLLGLEFTHWRDIEPFKKQKPSGMKSDYIPSIKQSDKDEIIRAMQDQADQEGTVMTHVEEYLEMVFEFLKEEGI